MSDELDNLLQDAERVAAASGLARDARAALHQIIDLWPVEGLPNLMRAVLTARVQHPDEWVRRPWRE
jgi:hypothetical protein